jgi:hypothetical protein
MSVNVAATLPMLTPSHDNKPRPRWLVLPAAAQALQQSASRQLQITEGNHRIGLFLIVCGLLAVIIPTEIAFDAEMFVSRTILGIPPHFALTAFTFALALGVDLRYYQRIVARPLVALSLFILVLLLAVGASRYGFGSYLVRSDVYIIRWFFVGFMLMRLSIVAGMLRPYLVFAAIVILLTALGIDMTNTDSGQINTATKRVSSSNLWPVINCGTIMIGMLLTVTWPRRWTYAGFAALAFGLLTFLGGIRSSTRSLFLFQSLCFILALIALSRDPRMRGRGRGIRRAATAFTVLAATFTLYQVATGALFAEYSQLGSRIQGTSLNADDTGYGRILEALGMIEELTPAEWVLGKGLGGMFYSKLGAWTNVPHIAVTGWLQKGGLAVFLLVLINVYIAPIFSFFATLLRPRRTSPLPPPILLVGPALVSWCMLTLVSGGIDIGSLLGLGGLTALWMQTYEDDKRFVAQRRPGRQGGLYRSAPMPGALVAP